MTRRSLFGKSELFTGILFIIFGILACVNPRYALGAIVIAYSIVVIFSGIADIIFYIRINRRSGVGPILSLIAGIFNIFLGILLLLNINAGKWVFSFIFPFWFIAHCISRLINLNFVRGIGGNVSFWISLITNIIGIAFGFILLFNPLASMFTLGYLIGFILIVLGVGNILIGLGKSGEWYK